MSWAPSQQSELGADDSVSQIMMDDEDPFIDYEVVQDGSSLISQGTLKSTGSSGGSRPFSVAAYFVVTSENLEEARGFLKVMSIVEKYSNC